MLVIALNLNLELCNNFFNGVNSFEYLHYKRKVHYHIFGKFQRLDYNTRTNVDN